MTVRPNYDCQTTTTTHSGVSDHPHLTVGSVTPPPQLSLLCLTSNTSQPRVSNHQKGVSYSQECQTAAPIQPGVLEHHHLHTVRSVRPPPPYSQECLTTTTTTSLECQATNTAQSGMLDHHHTAKSVRPPNIEECQTTTQSGVSDHHHKVRSVSPP